MSYTLEEKAERVSVMKRTPFARCSMERLGGTMDPAESWQALIEQHIYAEIIDVYLRNFVAPIDEENRCPFCGVGFFGWGLVYGEGNCACGWPATLYHRIRDTREDGDLLCEDKECGRRRDEHVPETRFDRVEFRCPEHPSTFPHSFSPPLIVGFTRLLWAHPYSVHLRGRNGQ